MIIKNSQQLATTPKKKQTLEILESGIKSVLPRHLVKKSTSFDSNKKILAINNDQYNIKGRIFIIGGGKASGAMAEELEKIIGQQNITAGIINCKDNNYKTEKIKIIQAGHPTPDEKGLQGVRQMLALKDKYNINQNDIIITLISGGGSALLPYPDENITLQDKQKINNLLLKSGAEIEEINNVRKKISKIKGGKLGQYFAPTTIISLIISDVIGNDPKNIASGPTTPDITTNQDALKILEKYNLTSTTPKAIIEHLNTQQKIIKELNNCHNYIIGNNKMALQAMFNQAKKLSLNPTIITSKLKGNPEQQAQKIAQEIANNKYSKFNALILGGETTPKLPPKHGQGGRNMHYIAASILALKDYSKNWTLTSISTDGSDFLKETAGAIADNGTIKIIQKKNLDLQSNLDNFDTYNLFKKIDNSLIITGPTKTNVGDILVYLL